MADKTIGSLDKLETLDREAKFAVESGGKSYYGEVGQLEDNATAAAKEYADQAKTDADRAAEKAKDAEDIAIHPPVLKDGSDNWWTWSVEANDYVESDKDAGVSLDISPETITGEPGSDAKVDNLGTKTDPVLQFTLPRGEKGVSPTVEVSKVDKTTTITITDEAGAHVATVLDGEDGAGQVTSVNGQTGEVSITAEDVGAYTKSETDAKVNAKADLVNGRVPDVQLGRATKDIDYYIDVSTGSDSTGDGTEEHPFATITHAINLLPKDMHGHRYYLHIAPGTYAESVVITEFFGGADYNSSKDIRLVSTTGNDTANCPVIRGMLQIAFNTINVEICNMEFAPENGYQDIIIRNQRSCTLNRVKCTGKTATGIYTSNVLWLQSYYCQITGKTGQAMLLENTIASSHQDSGRDNAVYFAVGNSVNASILLNHMSGGATTTYAKTSGGVVIEDGAIK